MMKKSRNIFKLELRTQPNPIFPSEKDRQSLALCHQSVRLSPDKPISDSLIIHETLSENESKYISEHPLSWSLPIRLSVERLLNSIYHLFVSSGLKGLTIHKYPVWWRISIEYSNVEWIMLVSDVSHLQTCWIMKLAHKSKANGWFSDICI